MSKPPISRFVHAVILVCVVAGTGCSKHQVYGRPAPRDTVPSEKSPPSPEPSPKEPGEVPD
jgi:hypothetical protein